MSTSDYPKTPGFLTMFGTASAFFGPLALPVLPLSYLYGKHDWRRSYQDRRLAAPDPWLGFIKINWLGMLFFCIPVLGSLAGADMINAWYLQGLKAAASEVGMTQ